MRVITEDHLRELAHKGLLTINNNTRTDSEVSVHWVYGEVEHLLITQNKGTAITMGGIIRVDKIQIPICSLPLKEKRERA